MTKTALAAAIAAAISAAAASTANAAVFAPTATAVQASDSAFVEPIQYWRGRGYYYGGPRFYAAPRPWVYRPWYRRPYYGVIVGGVALGTIVAVSAYGLAPPPPRPDLCWYWADRDQSRGYWDYC